MQALPPNVAPAVKEPPGIDRLSQDNLNDATQDPDCSQDGCVGYSFWCSDGEHEHG
eukprot:CAMPEP_0171698750 /NCGR_PEP_ID=MMETSP0991-20121206/9530_1 /TAXON_ID=483369 /ORGANISM="non described non described, Strain CCMP2098" /LENGTH=55 /DNA_ID=CAMNT_0012287649 /DNA_START=616 /DNA_END=784 /DNA_ORIENTATION=+